MPRFFDTRFYLRFGRLAVGLEEDLLADGLVLGAVAALPGRAGALPLDGALGGGAEGLSVLGGTARIRHFGPEPIRSSRCALSSASRTR